MYLSKRGIVVRNVAASLTNGGITLVILLIAPLGLAAVIINTLLISGSTFVVCGVMDGISIWLLRSTAPPQSMRAKRDDDLLSGQQHSRESLGSDRWD